MKKQNLFLLMAAIGIFPVALSYGFLPSFLFGVEMNSVEVVNIFRAIMGLYTAMGIFWLMAAFDSKLTQAGLYSLVAFMSGLSVARIVSINLDGMPNAILLGYTAIELALASVAYLFIKQEKAQQQQQNMIAEKA
ncbi:hypothetical protein JCM19231_587 [Vibrio ishigakensis]|uniref:DUF4345 domain-containing protein n=2 Tax=Vibrio ishigakensis TaxID=1481914 RepID=A0A0B8P468_9VIBR|nr:DUF4345 domain-containing protein [Vibrio ishigakensis]GAM58088.1 hypothetical protein JCM19231_587 [Vibrio ishigakensis]